MVSKVKASQVALILSLAFAFPSEASAENSDEKVPFVSVALTQMQKYEYCIKIYTVCQLVFDSPPDYEDQKDAAYMSNAFDNDYDNDAELVGVDKQLKKEKCIPEYLTGNENQSFWKNVRQWQREVEEMFLDTNIFTIKEEMDNGNAIKINLWTIFKIRKTVICNKTETHDEVLTATTIDPSQGQTGASSSGNGIENQMVCNEHQELGLWISQQVGITKELSQVIKILPKVLKKLELRANRNCCPFAILGDRIEIINDNIDSVLELKSMVAYNRSAATGNALIDFQNLIIRLEYLNKNILKGKQSKNSYCNDFNLLSKDAQQNFNTKLKHLQTLIPTPGSIYKRLIANLKSMSLIYSHQNGRLLITEKLYNNGSLTTGTRGWCCNTNDSKWLTYDIQLYDFKNHSSTELYNSINSSSDSIQSSQVLVNTEETKLNELILTCKINYESRQKKLELLNTKLGEIDIKVKHISSGVANKDTEIKDINFYKPHETTNNGKISLDSIGTNLNSMLSQALSINHSQAVDFNNLVYALTAFNSNKDIVLKNCLEIVTQLKHLQTLAGIHDAQLNSFDNIMLNKDGDVKDIYHKIHDFLEMLSMKSATSTIGTTAQPTNDYNIILNLIAKQIQENSYIAVNISKEEDNQSNQIAELKTKQENEIASVVRKIELADFLSSEIKKLVERRFFELETKFNESSLSPADNLINKPDLNKKFDVLETAIIKMAVQKKGEVTHMLERIIKLQSQIKSINDKLKQADEEIPKCSLYCDFGELPNIKELLSRLAVVKIRISRRYRK